MKIQENIRSSILEELTKTNNEKVLNFGADIK